MARTRETQSFFRILKESPDLIYSLLRRVVRRDSLAVYHPLGIVAFVRKQHRSAPQRLKTTHFSAIRTRHIYCAVQYDFGRRKYPVVIPSKYGRFRDGPDRRRPPVAGQGQKSPERRFCQLTQAGPVQVILDIVLASKFRDRFQYRCPPNVMSRIASDEQHVDRSVLAKCEWRQLRVVRREEVRRAIALLIPFRKNRRKITDHEIIMRKRRVPRRHGLPGDGLLYATRQALDKGLSPTGRVEVVKYVRAVLFDLRLQNIAKRCTSAQAVLARPNPLNVAVITIGEKCPLRSLLDRQKNVTSRLSKVHKRGYLTCERRMVFGQFANPRAQRGIVSGILEEPHKLISRQVSADE